MGNVQKVRLGDCCSIRRGSSPRPIKDYIVFSKGMPWIKIQDAIDAKGKHIKSTAEQIKMEGVKKSVVVHPGDLILSNSGTITVGVPFFVDIEACIHDGWQLFSDFDGIDKDYLYYYLIYMQKDILHNANDSIMTNLTLDQIRDLKIYLPSEEIQKKIVSILIDLDDKIAANNQIIRNLSELRVA